MKKIIYLLIICTIVDSLSIIRPNAIWNLSGDSYEGLEWLDTKQTKPTKAEIDNGIANCQVSKDKLISDIKDTKQTSDQRLEALITYLGI